MATFKKNPFEIPDFSDKKDFITREIKVGVIDEDVVNSEIYDEDAEALQELIDNIDSVGLSTPLTVRRNKGFTDRYTLISEHRRLKAVKSLGFTSVPCLVISTENEEDELKADVMHLTSNILTRERTILERAREAKLLKERIKALKAVNPDAYQGKTDNIVAKALNVSSSYVRQLVRIENADEDIKELISDELIGISDALKLQSMDEADKVEITERIRKIDNDDDLKKVEQTKLKKQISRDKKEKSVDEVIKEDLKTVERLIVRINSNIIETESCFKSEIEKIVDILQKIR